MKSLFLSLLCILTVICHGQSPIGLWKTIDDETNEPKSHIEIYQNEGKLCGKIVKLVNDEASSICDKCSGDMKDKPIVGLTILKNLEKNGKKWSGGTITDPNNGKTYKTYISLENKNKLKVRGFIGFSLLGRTQYWYRLED